jgi:hypothetical protein
MSNTNDLNAPEHCLQALIICIEELNDYTNYSQKQNLRLQDAMHYHAGAVTGLQALRAERDRYRAALEEIARRWAQPARSIAKEVLGR